MEVDSDVSAKLTPRKYSCWWQSLTQGFCILVQWLALSADDETFICQKTFNKEDGGFSEPPKELSGCALVQPVQANSPFKDSKPVCKASPARRQ